FYRSRYQFLRKWRSRPSFFLTAALLFLRLSVNFLLSLIGTVITLGQVRNIRQKMVVYRQIIQWHFKH
ncbi:MAG: hypothetical protein R6W75_00890, partial [Smithellaceae bacterium]